MKSKYGQLFWRIPLQLDIIPTVIIKVCWIFDFLGTLDQVLQIFLEISETKLQVHFRKYAYQDNK